MTDFFPKALEYTVGIEKGFVNDPDDAGGPTNYGITQAVLSAYRGHPCTAFEVSQMELSEAAEIYRAKFWNSISLDRVRQPLITQVMFDAAVLFGPAVSVLYAQKALIDCNYYSLQVDGHAGPRTIEALNSVRPEFFVRSFADVLKARVSIVVASRPKNIKYRDGWENRIEGYLKLI